MRPSIIEAKMLTLERVKTTRHQQTHDLSKEVHRIGFHFPTVVVEDVCAHYGITLSAQGTLLKEEERNSFQKRRQNKNQHSNQKQDQTTINTEARDAIKDLFPDIPDNDLHQIIKTAFQLGQKKVGTSFDLALIRRAQLSVVAHVRHTYTKYDSLLKRVQWNEARSMVEGPTLRKLVEWRGDEATGKDALEDVLREVIVISDDEESDDDVDEVRQNVHSSSMAFKTSPIDHIQVEVMPINYGHTTSTKQPTMIHLSDDEAPTGYRYVPQKERRKAAVGGASNHRRVHRYDAWERAREQYRANPGFVLDDNQPDHPTSKTAGGFQTAASHPANPNRSPEIRYERPYKAPNVIDLPPIKVRALCLRVKC